MGDTCVNVTTGSVFRATDMSVKVVTFVRFNTLVCHQMLAFVQQ